MKLPQHLRFAIEHEEMCIARRKKQIEGYKKKIELLQGGMDYLVVNQKVMGVSGAIKFNVVKYNVYKKQYKK